MFFAPRLSHHSRRLLQSCCVLSTLLLAAPSRPIIAQETPTPRAAAITADAVQEAFVRVTERIKPSVVTIYAERATLQSDENAPGDIPGVIPEEGVIPPIPDGPDDDRTSLGTGMVLNAQGQILTNYHVVKDAAFIRVLFGSETDRPERPLARLIGFDEESDLAVLQLAPGAPRRAMLRPVEFADSDAVRVGEWAIAVGAPFDQTQTVTVGIISAKSRHLTRNSRSSLQDYLQTDASINPGNSGGPLVNLEGKVIGINTAILSPSRFNVGIGFAVPSNAIQRYLPVLIAGQSIARGFLGIQYVAINEEVAREFNVPGGMQIGALAKQGDKFIGPAKNAGLLEGDIITQVNQRSIISSDEFRSLVAQSTPGTTLSFTVLRPGEAKDEMLEFKVSLGDRNTQNGEKPVIKPWETTPKAADFRLGIRSENADELTLSQKDKLGLPVEARGAIITEIIVGSPADAADLQRGLRLVRARVANGKWQKLPDKKSFLDLENTLKAGDRVLLQVRDKQDITAYKLLVVDPN